MGPEYWSMVIQVLREEALVLLVIGTGFRIRVCNDMCTNFRLAAGARVYRKRGVTEEAERYVELLQKEDAINASMPSNECLNPKMPCSILWIWGIQIREGSGL